MPGRTTQHWPALTVAGPAGCTRGSLLKWEAPGAAAQTPPWHRHGVRVVVTVRHCQHLASAQLCGQLPVHPGGLRRKCRSVRPHWHRLPRCSVTTQAGRRQPECQDFRVTLACSGPGRPPGPAAASLALKPDSEFKFLFKRTCTLESGST